MRKLLINYQKINNTEVRIQVRAQSHYNKCFVDTDVVTKNKGSISQSFYSKVNNYVKALVSDEERVRITQLKVYVRGSKNKEDKKTLVLRTDQFDEFAGLVLAYNQAHNNNKEKLEMDDCFFETTVEHVF